MRRNNLLIVKTYDRDIIRNRRSPISQCVVQAHRDTVVMTAHAGGPRGEHPRPSIETALLIRLYVPHEIRVDPDPGSFQGGTVAGEPADSRRRVDHRVDEGDATMPLCQKHLRGSPTALKLIRDDTRQVTGFVLAID